MKKEEYFAPTMEIVVFEYDDVIADPKSNKGNSQPPWAHNPGESRNDYPDWTPPGQSKGQKSQKNTRSMPGSKTY